jgi:hypothetical protein
MAYPQTRGACVYCGRELTRAGMTRHLPTCPARKRAIAQADGAGGKPEALHHLVIRDQGSGLYWLHLEMRGTSTLETLDSYLRSIWLECCGHLSQFTIEAWTGQEIPMGRHISRVFVPGVELMHLYDYGTTSYTLVRCASVRSGRPLTRHPITLMARNNPPDYRCMYCDQSAHWLCNECMIEEDESGLLCDEHVQGHPHEDNYGPPIPLVNSPRVGMCAYEGPAEPPY